MSMRQSVVRAASLAIGASLLATASTAALGQGKAQQTPEQFYKGNTVRIMIGHPPGGSYDLYARLGAEGLKKHLPGNPTIIVESKPGGGGLVAAAFFYAQAPKDGTMLAIFPETLAHTQVLEPELAKWKVEDMRYIGSFAPVNSAFVVRGDFKAKTPAELRKTPITVGSSGVNSQSYQYPALLKSLGNYPFKIVAGYPGSADYILALEKGEVDLVSSAWNNWRATHRTHFEKGTLAVVMQSGLRRNRELGQVPLLQETVTDPKARRVIEFATAGAAIGRALLSPPGVPADRVAVLRATFDKMVKDREFIDTAAKRNLELDPTGGQEVDKAAASIVKAPKDLIEAAQKAQKG